MYIYIYIYRRSRTLGENVKEVGWLRRSIGNLLPYFQYLKCFDFVTGSEERLYPSVLTHHLVTFRETGRLGFVYYKVVVSNAHRLPS